MLTNINEKASTLTAKAADEGQAGDFILTLITPGWGSSGYYSAKVLEAAAKRNVFPKGTQNFLNHQTAEERNTRPEGDVMALASVQQEDAYWDGSELVARVRPFQHYGPILKDMKEAIGVSIRASAEISEGEAEGRRGIIVDELIEAQSVDYVTRAGRGGRIREVLESARVVDEALTDDRRRQLQSLLPPRSYSIDHDDAARYVYYRSYEDVTDESKTWRQTFTVTNDVASALEGDPVEVQQQTTYVPVSSAGQANESHKENHMPQIEEARLRELTEAEGRLTTLIAERDAAKSEADTAKAALAESSARTDAEKRARAALATTVENGGFLSATVDRIVNSALSSLPMKEGALDVTAFDAKVEEAKKAETDYLEALKPQGITGFGASAPATESAAGPRVNAWGRTITKEA